MLFGEDLILFLLSLVSVIFCVVAIVAISKNREGGRAFFVFLAILFSFMAFDKCRDLSAGNPAEANNGLRPGALYCTEWSDGGSQYVIHNVGENRNYFVHSVQKLPAGCFVKTEKGDTEQVDQPKPATPETK